VTGQTIMRDYAIGQMNRLLTRLAFQVHRAAKTPGPGEIHDVRVSIRRFSQGLLIFDSLLPKPEIKKIRKALKGMMRLTSEIRNRDIALEFLMQAKHPRHQPRLRKERAAYQRQFTELVRRWTAREFSAKWRNRLLLERL